MVTFPTISRSKHTASVTLEESYCFDVERDELHEQIRKISEDIGVFGNSVLANAEPNQIITEVLDHCNYVGKQEFGFSCFLYDVRPVPLVYIDRG